MTISTEVQSGKTRKKTAPTPQEYVEAIDFYADKTTINSLYPGYVFQDLALFLKEFTRGPAEEISTNESQQRQLATLFTIQNGVLKSRTFSNAPNCIQILEQQNGEQVQKPQAHILFMNGYPTPEWIAYTGSFCNVDPEFFSSHLSFRCRRDYFSSPSLPSANRNIITLKIVTIGSREVRRGDSGQQCVEKLRAEGAKSMRKYEHELMVGNRFEPGDSIVRKYSVLDEKHFIIEQNISICFNKVGEDLITIVCSDAGNDLSRGPLGPWSTEVERTTPWPWTMFYPTIQQRPRIALKIKANNSDGPASRERKFPQSAVMLSQDYGRLLDKKIMASDPFYALDEIFQFCAFSYSQFLNIMDATINAEAGHSSMSLEKPTLANLLEYQRILESHLPHLQRNIKVIRQHNSVVWPPHATEENRNRHEKAKAAMECLLTDMEYLELRAKDLLERCKTGMNVLMNYVMLAESRQAISQGQRVEKLTLLAFLYIPLSFTCTFFGMNVSELMSGNLSIWLWFVTAAPVFALSVGFFYIDFHVVSSFWRSRSKKFRMKF